MQKNKNPADVSVIDSFPIAIIVSLFNRPITQALQDGAINQLKHRGISEGDIAVFTVPGAVEIPIAAKRLAMKQRFKAILALGAVIRGETTHYELVCEAANNGCQRVSLDYDIPVIFGVLTTENEEQAWDRLGGKWGHKGVEAADCAISMQQLLSQLESI